MHTNMKQVARIQSLEPFPPIVSVQSVQAEKLSVRARVDSWRRRSSLSTSLPSIAKGSVCLECTNGGFVQHVRHKRAVGESVRISLALCAHNHTRSIVKDMIGRFSNVLEDTGDSSPMTADVIWVNQPSANSLRTFSPHQRMNVFPFLNRMMTKANIAKQLNLHRILFPMEFDFYPETLELPRDSRMLQRLMRHENERTTWIMKPTKGLQGIGIVLARSWSQVEHALQEAEDKVFSVQRYLDRPMLMEGTKWDMRIYVALESLSPFKAHLFKDGLARFATEPYVAPQSDNLGQTMVHLTNYSLNKKSRRFRMYSSTTPEEDCHKRTISTTIRQLNESGHRVESAQFWDEVGAIVGKTLVAMWPQLQDSHATYFKKVGSNQTASYDQACFHILGFDIMMDAKGKLWLLEVNSNPSFNRDSVIDAVINEQVIESVLRIVKVLDPSRRPINPDFTVPVSGDGAVSTDDDDESTAIVKSKSCEPDHLHGSYASRLPHFQPMESTSLYLDISYSHLLVFNCHVFGCGSSDIGEGLSPASPFASTLDTIWQVYVKNLWEPKRSSRASHRLNNALAVFIPDDVLFGNADAHLIYSHLQSFSTNRIYPWRQAYEFASDCPAMTFSMFCEAVVMVSRRWYPHDSPIDALIRVVRKNKSPSSN